MPSGSRARMSEAEAEAGKTSTSAIWLSWRKIVRLMPKSRATIFQRGAADAASPSISSANQDSLLVTSATRSTPDVPGSLFAASNKTFIASALSEGPKAPVIEPSSRMCRVRRRVSTPLSTAMPASCKLASKLCSERQLLGRRARSRTITPLQAADQLSLSSPTVP